MACVGVLKPRLGNKWNSAWQSAGFTDGSIGTRAKPLPLLQQMRAYFLANPTHQVSTHQPYPITAVACEAGAQAISDAQSLRNQSKTDRATAKRNFKNGLKAARRRYSGLRQELSCLLSDDDTRWYAFGFNKPSDPHTPDVPQNLVVLAGVAGSGTLAVRWEKTPSARGYRVRVLDLAGTVLAEKLCEDNETIIPNLPPGVSVTVSARNRTRESQPAPALTSVVP
jgi:hypothetical protein